MTAAPSLARASLKFKPLPQIERLHQAFELRNGVLFWRWRGDVPPKVNGRYAGKPAGWLRPDGRLEVCFDGVRYRVHRIVFAMTSGSDPLERDVDHKDRDRGWNAPSNLRAATRSENNHNSGERSDNKSGQKGVSFVGREQKWKSAIGIYGKTISLGYHSSFDVASKVYRFASAILLTEFSPYYPDALAYENEIDAMHAKGDLKFSVRERCARL